VEEYQQLTLMAIAVHSASVSQQVQQALWAFMDRPERAKQAWELVLLLCKSQSCTSSINHAELQARFRQKPHEGLREYTSRVMTLRYHLAEQNMPLREATFCAYLIKGLNREWEMLASTD